MEDLCGGFFDCAGTPRLGGKSAWETGTRSRSDTTAAMPATDDNEHASNEEPMTANEEPIKAKPATEKESEILGLSSPDPQAFPARKRVRWAGQESFTWSEEPSCFFPDDACSDSSSACADDDDGNESSESESGLDRSDVDSANGVDAFISYDGGEVSVAALDGQRLTLDNFGDTVQTEGAAAAAIGEDEQNTLLPVEHFERFVAVHKLVDMAPQRTISHRMAAKMAARMAVKMVVVVAALTTFVLGMTAGVRDGAASSFSFSGGVPSTGMALYVHPTIENAAESSPAVRKPGLGSDTEPRYLGRTAAASAAAAVGTLTSQLSPFGAHTASKTTEAVDEIDAQIQAVRRMRVTREIIEEVQDAWIEVTFTAAQGGAVPGLLDGPGPGALDLVDAHGTPPTIVDIPVFHPPVGWFAKSLDRLTRNYKPGFEGLMNGPWV